MQNNYLFYCLKGLVSNCIVFHTLSLYSSRWQTCCCEVCKCSPIVPSAGWSSILEITIRCYIIWSCTLSFWLFSSAPRAPEPQKPQTRVGDDVVRPNHYDPDEDEEYYRKQLSYFDRRSFDNKAVSQPNTGVNRFHEPAKTSQPQIGYPFARYRIMLERQYLFLYWQCSSVCHTHSSTHFPLQDGVCGESESCGQEVRASATRQPVACSIQPAHTCCSTHIPAQTQQHRGWEWVLNVSSDVL